MASARTTIVLGPRERRAAKRLALRWGVTPSEAIRRAVVQVDGEQADSAHERKRRQRRANLPALFRAFAGRRKSLEAELERINAERDAW